MLGFGPIFINPIPYGGGQYCPLPTYCRITQIWPAPKARAFGTFMRHFHNPVKNYEYFVQPSRENPLENAENHDKPGKTPIM